MDNFEAISKEKLNKVFIEKKLNIDCKCRNENIYIDIQNKILTEQEKQQIKEILE